MKSLSKQQASNVKEATKMSTAQFFATAIEIIIAFGLVIGFMYEPAIARWEQKQARKVLKAFKKRREYWR